MKARTISVRPMVSRFWSHNLPGARPKQPELITQMSKHSGVRHLTKQFLWSRATLTSPYVNHNLKLMESIPDEVLIHIFFFITRRRELAHVSLVCRHWNTLAFAELYRTLYLMRQIDVESISERILFESEYEASASLRISTVLRCLIAGPIYREGNPQHFSKQVISKLVHLEHLTWDDPESLQPCNMLTYKQHCPNLRSVALRISGADLSRDGRS